MQQLVLQHAVVDLSRGRVRHAHGLELRLTDLEVRLLSYLADRAGQRVDRAELQREVWGNRTTLSTRAVDMAVSRLRRKVEPEPKPTVLLTTRGGGYRLVLPETTDRRAEALELLAALDGADARDAAEAALALAEELESGTPFERGLAIELRSGHASGAGTWEQRVAWLEAGIEELGPDVPRLKLALGQLFYNTDPARSRALLTEALDDESTAPAARFGLALVRQRSDGFAAVFEELDHVPADGGRMALRADAFRAYAEYLAGRIDFEEAVERLQIAGAGSEEDGDLHGAVRAGMWMARLQRNDGDLQGAFATRRRCIEQCKHLINRIFEGSLEMEDGFDHAHGRDFEAALGSFDRAATILAPAEPARLRYVQMCRGLVLLQLRRHDEARVDL